jgi:putative sigma-54 modulation protein
MQIHLTGHHIDITPALKQHASEKLQRLEKRYQHITQVNLILKVDNHQHIAEANIHVSGTDIHATAEASDMYSAIDLLIDKLIAQITKHKEKITDHR